MKIKRIEKTIDLQATAEKVWDVLILDELNRQWYAEFSEGTYADTDWKTGSRVRFVDKSNNGILGFITDSQPGKYLAIEYDGMLINNKDDFDSEDAKMLNGATETYTLTEDAGVTRLDITSDMTEDYYDMMSAQWDIALQKIKALAETK